MTGSAQTTCNLLAGSNSGTTCATELVTDEAGGLCGSTGTTTNSCASLSVCCGQMSAAEQPACQQVVLAGNATSCSTELEVDQRSGSCASTGTSSGGPGSSGGQGSSSLGSSSGPGSSTSFASGSSGQTSSHSSSSGSSGQDAGSGAACSPHAPTGVTIGERPSLGKTSCTAATLATFEADCETDASTSATCAPAETGTCFDCIITPNAETAANWGALLLVAPSGALNGFQFQLVNIGGCVLSVDPSSAGQSCGRALQEQEECELAACIPYCPVTGATDTAGENALFGTYDSSGTLIANGCIENADTSACSAYVSATNSACAAESHDGGTGPLDRCATFLSSSSVTLTDLYGVYCGGADAGI